jgi:adhesin transport system membrane fusion protein
MPWTQSVESKGKVTTLNPEGRPQTITSRIAGRVENWFINEGDFVKKNDTIAFISEIKDEYMDPLLISRSEQQIKAKETTLRVL